MRHVTPSPACIVSAEVKCLRSTLWTKDPRSHEGVMRLGGSFLWAGDGDGAGRVDIDGVVIDENDPAGRHTARSRQKLEEVAIRG